MSNKQMKLFDSGLLPLLPPKMKAVRYK